MGKKIISLILGITIFSTMSIPVFADDDVTTLNNSGVNQATCEVSAVVDASYTVNLPAQLNLKRKPNSDIYSGKLEYGCKGDLACNQVVVINTDSVLEMSKTVATTDSEEKIHLRHVDVYEGDGTDNFSGSEPIIGSYITAEETGYAMKDMEDMEDLKEIFGSNAQAMTLQDYNGQYGKPLVSAAFFNNIPEVISFAGDHDLQDLTDEYNIDQYNENMDNSSSEYCMEEKYIMLHIGQGYQRNEAWEGRMMFRFKTESIG